MIKQITISKELEMEILRTESKLALKQKGKIFLVQEIKPGKNRTLIQMTNNTCIRTLNLRTLIRRGVEFINSKGIMFTPQSYEGDMFIMPNGEKVITGYTSVAEIENNRPYLDLELS